MTEETEIEFLRRERDVALRMHQVQFERANRLEMLAAGNAAGLRYWNRRYVETAQQHAVDIAAKDALRAQRQAVLDLCDEADQREVDGADGGVAELPANVQTRAVRAALGISS